MGISGWAISGPALPPHDPAPVKPRRPLHAALPSPGSRSPPQDPAAGRVLVWCAHVIRAGGPLGPGGHKFVRDKASALPGRSAPAAALASSRSGLDFSKYSTQSVESS